MNPTPYAAIFESWKVPEQSHLEFTQYVETGEASAAFVRELESNAGWQLALEAAFELRVGRLQDVLRALLND